MTIPDYDKQVQVSGSPAEAQQNDILSPELFFQVIRHLPAEKQRILDRHDNALRKERDREGFVGNRDNTDRADAAQAALDSYVATNTPQYADEDVSTQAADLIGDLLHLVAACEGEAAAHNAWSGGERHYHEETLEAIDAS